MRKGLAFHIAGDQHLGSTIQYGIDDWNDAGWALCVPSVANVFPRRWFPPQPGRNQKPGAPRYTGEFTEGFGNKVTVHAVSNPHDVAAEPAELHRRAPGYGIETGRAGSTLPKPAQGLTPAGPSPFAKPTTGYRAGRGCSIPSRRRG